MANQSRLSHDDVRRALDASAKDKEMTCPCCKHGHLQLFGTDGIKCQNGCATETVVAKVREILSTGEVPAPTGKQEPKAKKPKPSELPGWSGISLFGYCALHSLDERVLTACFGAKELTRRGQIVLGWPYTDEMGKLLATKIRLSESSHDTYFEPADPHVPFGLSNPRLHNMIAGTYDLMLTEGESDYFTFASFGYPCLGISGAEGWFEEFAELPVIANARRIFIGEHRDDGGKKFTATILKSLPRAIVLRPPEGFNDWNDVLQARSEPDEDRQHHPFVQSIDIAIQAGSLEAALRQPKPAKQKPSPMRPEAFYGLAGEIVSLIEPFLEADRATILANVLCCTSVLFQHEAYFKVVANKHYPANYFLMVGNTAKARKGTTSDAVLELAERVQPQFTSKILTGLSTGQGLIKALIKTDATNIDKELPPPPIAETVLIEVSEFSELLAVMKRDENTLVSVMRNAWDGKILSVLTRNEPLKVGNVSLATLCHITKTELLDKLTSTDRANGFANRYLLFWTERSKLLPRGDISQINYNAVVTKLHAAVDAAKGIGEIKRDAEAEALWAIEYTRLNTGLSSTMMDALLARAEAHIVRLSLLYALLDCSKVVRKEHLKAAIAVWDFVEASVRYVFQGSPDPESGKILRYLEDHSPATSSEIRRFVFGDNKSAEWAAEKMHILLEVGKVRQCKKEFKTKTLDAWSLAEGVD